MLLPPRDSASLPRRTLALLVAAALLVSFDCFPELLSHSIVVPTHHAWTNTRISSVPEDLYRLALGCATMKNLSVLFLKRKIDAQKNFEWHWLPSSGKSGQVASCVHGVGLHRFGVENVALGEFPIHA